MRAIAALKKLGRGEKLTDEEIAKLDELEKATTFGERMAQRELDDELPNAMDTLRSVIWNAYYPAPGSNEDPETIISTSLDEFKTWALDLLGRVSVAKSAGDDDAIEELQDEIRKLGVSDADADTVEDVDDAAAKKFDDRLEKVEQALEALPEQIAKAVKGEGDEAPTAESVQADVAELRTTVTDTLAKIDEKVTKLGSGKSSQRETQPTPPPNGDPPPENGDADKDRLEKIASGKVPAAGIL